MQCHLHLCTLKRPSLNIISHPKQCHIGHHCISRQLAPLCHATQCITRLTATANTAGHTPPLNNGSPRCSTLRTVDTTAHGLRVLVIIEIGRFVGRHAHRPSTGGHRHPTVSVVHMSDSVLPAGWVLKTPSEGHGIKIYLRTSRPAHPESGSQELPILTRILDRGRLPTGHSF